jgi:hypothetical protein
LQTWLIHHNGTVHEIRELPYNAKKVAHMVQRVVKHQEALNKGNDPVQVLVKGPDYERLFKYRQTVVSAFITDENQTEIYRTLSKSYTNITLYHTSDINVATEVLNLKEPGLLIEHRDKNYKKNGAAMVRFESKDLTKTGIQSFIGQHYRPIVRGLNEESAGEFLYDNAENHVVLCASSGDGNFNDWVKELLNSSYPFYNQVSF